MSGLKRTAVSAGLDAARSSPRKRARLDNPEQLKLIGVVPSMTIPTCAKTSPDPGIVESIKQILLSGLKSQKQVAIECGLRYDLLNTSNYKVITKSIVKQKDMTGVVGRLHISIHF